MRPVIPAAIFLIATSTAQAGMPSFRLSDVAEIRMQELSFFIFVLLLCALGVKLAWNLFARDFPKLPRLGYWRAFAATVLLAVFSLLVLSMVSGARELLTPGAWRRQGATHRLTDPAGEPVRRKGLESLRAALWRLAAANGGVFLRHDFSPEMDDGLWNAPDKEKTRYHYVGGLRTDTPKTILVAEPGVFGGDRFVLLTDGSIEKWSEEKVGVALAQGEQK